MTDCKWSRALLTLTLCACAPAGMEPVFNGDDEEGAGVKIMFVGNSLTYVHDVPGLVRQLADQHGVPVLTASFAYGNYSLQDHWHNGIAAHIRRLRPDFVVMQQGPSSLPESREHLVYWSQQLAAVVRDAGAEPALYMVWPDAGRRLAFPAVEGSYAEAAQAVNGVLLPAGTTWLRAWELEPALELYAGDGLHSSYLGALAAALTIFAGIFELDAAMLPSLADGVPAAHIEALHAAVAASLQHWQLQEQR